MSTLFLKKNKKSFLKKGVDISMPAWYTIDAPEGGTGESEGMS